MPKDTCAVEDCEKFARTTTHNGWCSMHYTRWRRHGDIHYVGKPRGAPKKNRKCDIVACEHEHYARGFCIMHYGRWRNHGDPHVVYKRGTSSGSIKSGYVWLHRPDHPNANGQGKLYEHKLVMAKKLGRPIRKGEEIHHKNGIRGDNRLENLELWISKHPRGQRVTDLLEWAHHIIDTYEPIKERL